jgi:hypothetical protein
MSNPTQKKLRPRVVAPVAGLAMLAGGYALGAYLAPGPEFAEAVGSACRGLTHEDNAEAVSALAPSAEGYAVHESVREKPGYYSGLCTVEAEGDQVLYLTVEFTGYRSFDAWDAEVSGGFIPSDDRERLTAAGGGWSTPGAAAVYVPCTMTDGAEKKKGGLSVRVKTDEDGGHRTQLADIAERAAEQAGSLGGPCADAG